MRAHLPVLVGKLAGCARGDGRPSTWRSPPTAPRCGRWPTTSPAAGLRRVNISLDSLRRDRFVELTRRDELDQVLDGIDAALEAGLDPVKVNVVVMRGVNDDEVVDFARFGRDRGVTVRFIEFMPLDADERWQSERGGQPGRDRRRHRRRATRSSRWRGATEPAERFAYRDGARRDRRDPVGHPRRSAASCDRVRLTADGQLRTCLFAVDEVDLRALRPAGATDDELAAAVAALRRRQVGRPRDRPGARSSGPAAA